MEIYKRIIEHILEDSHFPELKQLGKKHDELEETITKAKDYASGGKFEKDKSQEVLHSIFDGLGGSEKKGYAFDAQVLNLSEKLFPKTSIKKTDFSTCFTGFANEFNKIKDFKDKAFAETCLALMEKYFTTIPCQVKGLETVSLFDFMKSVAGFMVCLQESEDVLLVGGDISGIQSFIYDIIGKNASKNLKGRSFYLQILVDNALQKMLDNLGLFIGNVIYSSGGGFFILAPNNEEVINTIKSTSKEINKLIFDYHKTGLFLAVDLQKITLDNLLITWKSLSEKLAKQKRVRYNQNILGDYSFFFEASETGGLQERDAITNEEFGFRERKIALDDNYIKVSTKRQIDLGRFLKEANYWIKSKKGNALKKELKVPLFRNIVNFFSDSLPNTQQANISTINDINFIPKRTNSNAYSFTFYGGNKYPINDTNELENGKVISRKGEIKTFDRLAGEEGFRRLGVLRMDVDGLGAIFQKGFPTFSQYSTLSRSLDWFFKGYLNTLWESDKKYKDNTYILYSGGDDLFIIGKWNNLIDLADEIHNQFRKWACLNDKVGLSGGIAIVAPKFPIAKAASMAEDAEKLAKEHTCNGQEKNAFALMGIPLNWDYEYPLVQHLKNELVKIISDDKMPKGFLQRITGFYEQAKSQRAKGQNEAWRWRIAYDFSQVRKRLKDNQQSAKIFLDQVKEAVFTDRLLYLDKEYQKLENNKYNFLELLNLAARWAELEIRTK
jgi:CRISPR-associated protein Csm1